MVIVMFRFVTDAKQMLPKMNNTRKVQLKFSVMVLLEFIGLLLVAFLLPLFVFFFFPNFHWWEIFGPVNVAH